MAAPSVFSIALFLCSASFLPPLLAQDAATQVLDGINKYRTNLGYNSLAKNAGAGCMAEKLLTIYEGQDCSNNTGLGTPAGSTPEDPNYLTWLSSCNVDVKRTTHGEVLPNCVPAAESTSDIVETAVFNYTHAAAAFAVNGSSYESAGIAASSNNHWFILILATNTSDGDYLQQTGSSNNGSSLGYPIFTFLCALFITLYSFSF